MDLIHAIRGYVMPIVGGLTLAFGLIGIWSPGFLFLAALFGLLTIVGIHDLTQKPHSLLRNYPLLGHLRFLLEGAGPEMHQYFVESNTSGRPFDRDQRSLMYERAKNIEGIKPFGTELDVDAVGYSFIGHSVAPKPVIEDAARRMRVEIGGPDCKHPYSSSLLNISAMSFGALSGNAIRALNTAAKRGGFAHDTGEGGFSVHHREPGGDVIWQVGTGYFGCRTDDGHFDAGLYAETANIDQIKMVELKISQGAKPGHGGILPAAKVTAEIAAARKVPMGQDCFSPPGHTAFSTPVGMMEFIGKLREDCDGKPVGFKICLGDPREFFAICKAMRSTGIAPDFITVDGGEGGTGAAPLEFSDHLGMPLREGLLIARNTLVGLGLGDQVRIAASGKRVSSHLLASAFAFGASWCNIARGFMFSVGCIQSQRCHTNACPVGVATQDPRLASALIVEEKAERAYNFHRNTVQSLAEMTGACGLEHANDFQPQHLYERIGPHEVRRFDELYSFFEPGQLLEGRGDAGPRLQRFWDEATPDRFGPA